MEKEYERFPIQISSGVCVVMQIFKKCEHLEAYSCDCIKLSDEAYERPKVAARQFIDQLEEQWCAAFMMALRDEIDAELNNHDKKYGTKFSKYNQEKPIIDQK